MKENSHPIAEIFGRLPSDQSEKAKRYRSKRLCPFNNKVPNCTKDKAHNPLGVCSVMHNGHPVITCPIRFREEWRIADDAASFFFNQDASWTSLTEMRLNDANGKSAGNIDIVLVAYNEAGKVTDFGSLEIQAVYISGNIRNPFELCIKDFNSYLSTDWTNYPNYPRPDYLSSSRKRLAPQLLFKGGILHSWRKKCAVALNKSFYNTLPRLTPVKKCDADLAWLIYDLVPADDGDKRTYKMEKVDEIFTEFKTSLHSLTTPTPGKMEDFLKVLQVKLDEQLEFPPTNNTIEVPF